MRALIYVTHPDVVKDPDVPVPQWPLSARGRERMAAMLGQPWVGGIGAIHASTERKARDGAEILAAHLKLPYTSVAELGEIDRSSTGFLPHDAHAALARACFEFPDQSAGGWETARHAQQRVAQAVERLLRADTAAGDIALIGHGGVGTLLLCHLTGQAISLAARPGGADGGYYFRYRLDAPQLLSGWRRIEDVLPAPL